MGRARSYGTKLYFPCLGRIRILDGLVRNLSGCIELLPMMYPRGLVSKDEPVGTKSGEGPATAQKKVQKFPCLPQLSDIAKLEENGTPLPLGGVYGDPGVGLRSGSCRVEAPGKKLRRGRGGELLSLCVSGRFPPSLSGPPFVWSATERSGAPRHISTDRDQKNMKRRSLGPHHIGVRHRAASCMKRCRTRWLSRDGAA
jgi:hypothetical protein